VTKPHEWGYKPARARAMSPVYGAL